MAPGMRSISQLARLPRRGIIELTGRDAFKFLQGSITNDVHRLERKDDRDVFLAAFLNPQVRFEMRQCSRGRGACLQTLSSTR